MSGVTMQVRIGRIVVDGRVASTASGALHEAIQAELAALLADGAMSRDERARSANPLGATIAAGIAGRLDAMSVRTQSVTSPLSTSATTVSRGTGRG